MPNLAHSQEFVEALVCCSKRATREDRLTRIFSVFDVDGDGVISREDLELMVRQLAGSSFTCAHPGPPLPMPVLSRTYPERVLPPIWLFF